MVRKIEPQALSGTAPSAEPADIAEPEGRGRDLRPDACALSWGAPVRWIASVAVGAAAILSTSVAGAARDVLAWVCRVTVGRGGQRCSVVRASRLLVATVVAALLGTPAKVSDGVAPDPVEQRRAT